MQLRTLLIVISVFITVYVMPNYSGAQTGAKPKPDETVNNRILPVKSVPDQELETKLTNVLSKIDDFKDVRVSVQEGVVTLRGTVPRTEVAKKLENLVSRFEGVLYLNNKLTDETAIEDRIVPVMTRLSNYLAGFINKLPLFAIALPILLGFYLFAQFVGSVITNYGWFGDNRLFRNLISRLVRTVIILAGLILALDILDVTALVGAVIGTASLAGLAIGFAFKDIAENYLSGIILSARRPFAANDYILVENIEGKVVRMTSRELALMTRDGNYVTIPNSTVFKSVIVNYTRNSTRRFGIPVGVGVKEDLQHVRKVGLDALRATAGVTTDPAPSMTVNKLGDFNVVVLFYGWVDQNDFDYIKVNSEAVRVLKESLDAAGIEMPFPITTTEMAYSEVVPAKSQSVSEAVKIKQVAPSQKEHEDVSADSQIDKQIQKELATSKEENLLDKDQN